MRQAPALPGADVVSRCAATDDERAHSRAGRRAPASRAGVRARRAAARSYAARACAVEWNCRCRAAAGGYLRAAARTATSADAPATAPACARAAAPGDTRSDTRAQRERKATARRRVCNTRGAACEHGCATAACERGSSSAGADGRRQRGRPAASRRCARAGRAAPTRRAVCRNAAASSSGACVSPRVLRHPVLPPADAAARDRHARIPAAA